MDIDSRMATHRWDTSLAPDISPLFLALQWAQQSALGGMQPVLQACQLSAAEFDVLATLRNAPAPYQLTPSQIQSEVVITSGGLTKVMAQLEARGLIARSQFKDDMRVKPVHLTAAGQTLIESAMQDMIAATGQWVRAQLDAQEIAVLTRLLQKLVK